MQLVNDVVRRLSYLYFLFISMMVYLSFFYFGRQFKVFVKKCVTALNAFAWVVLLGFTRVQRTARVKWEVCSKTQIHVPVYYLCKEDVREHMRLWHVIKLSTNAFKHTCQIRRKMSLWRSLLLSINLVFSIHDITTFKHVMQSCFGQSNHKSTRCNGYLNLVPKIVCSIHKIDAIQSSFFTTMFNM